MAMMDMFMPANAAVPLTPEQTQNAQTLGWLGAANNLANMSANRPGSIQPSALQLLTGAFGGFQQNAQGYAGSVQQQALTAAQLQEEQAKASMAQLGAQRAIDHFSGGKGATMAPALASPAAPTLHDFYADTQGQPSLATPAPTAPATMGGVNIPPVSAAALQPGAGSDTGGSVPMPPPATAFSGMGGAAPQVSGVAPTPTAPAGDTTAMGLSPRDLAASLYKQGQDLMYMQQPGGDALIKEAISIDPSLVYGTAFQTSRGTAEGALPSELTKIGATGAQARMTAATEAKYRPHDQIVKSGGAYYTVPSNDYDVATGATPNVDTGQPSPAAVVQPQISVSGVAATPGSPVSTAIPLGADKLADKQAENAADTQQAQDQFDSRLNNAMKLLDSMKANAPQTFQGRSGQVAQAIAGEGIHVGPIHPWEQSNKAQTQFEQDNANLFTQELPAMIKGSGGRIDIPLLNSIKEASQIDPHAPVATKLAAIDNLKKILLMAQQNSHNLNNAATGNIGGNTTNSSAPAVSYQDGWQQTQGGTRFRILGQ